FCSLDAPPTHKIYTLSLHDALPIYSIRKRFGDNAFELDKFLFIGHSLPDDQIGKAQIIGKILEKNKVKPSSVGVSMVKLVEQTKDRKSTRLNSSHVKISYAVFCLKK